MSLIFNCLRLWIVFKWWGIAFNNIGSCTTNELSSMVRFACEVDLLLGETLAKFSSLVRETNETLMSFLVLPFRIFHLWNIMKRLRRRWRDISDTLHWRNSISVPLSPLELLSPLSATNRYCRHWHHWYNWRYWNSKWPFHSKWWWRRVYRHRVDPLVPL